MITTYLPQRAVLRTVLTWLAFCAKASLSSDDSSTPVRSFASRSPDFRMNEASRPVMYSGGYMDQLSHAERRVRILQKKNKGEKQREQQECQRMLVRSNKPSLLVILYAAQRK